MPCPASIRLSFIAAGAFAASGALSQQNVPLVGLDPAAASQSPRGSNQSTFDQIMADVSAGGVLLISNDSIQNLTAPALRGGASPGALASAQTNNLAVLNQFGTGNISAIGQIGFGNVALANLFGTSNTTSQSQSGNNNTSVLILSGNNNQGVTTMQTGNGNTVGFQFVGNNNTVSSNQNGNNLSFGLSVIGSGRVITVEQTGAGTQAAGLPVSVTNAIAAAKAR